MSEEQQVTETAEYWFTIPSFGLLPQVDVPKPPIVEVRSIEDVRTIAEDAKELVTSTVQDVRKNVGSTVVLIREIVGV
jgi:hypothetical protein